MLNPDEVSELNFHFMFVGMPLLIREIIGDLKKERGKGGIPEDVVKTLAHKMETAHGVQPTNFRDLALWNLCGTDVPMLGQVPVDPRTSNVTASSDGAGIIYDSTPEQQMWRMWASGDFTTDDQQTAAAWRAGLEKVDLRALGKNWKEFSKRQFGKARNLPELIVQVDKIFFGNKIDVQLELLSIILPFLLANQNVKTHVYNRFLNQSDGLINDLAPYAASVLKLYLTFLGGLALGFIGPRKSHWIDLQYLFYAPFCMVFASGDKFHRNMWGATAGVNTFVWGQALKDDLAQRVALRQQVGEEEHKAKQKEYGFHPIALEGSIINEVWKKYMTISPK